MLQSIKQVDIGLTPTKPLCFNTYRQLMTIQNEPDLYRWANLD